MRGLTLISRRRPADSSSFLLYFSMTFSLFCKRSAVCRYLHHASARKCQAAKLCVCSLVQLILQLGRLVCFRPEVVDLMMNQRSQSTHTGQ
jgi:hypothetical protein